MYRQWINNIYKSCQVICGEYSHLETKNARWNLLKTKQIQKLAVMAVWQPTGRPVGRPTDHPKKSCWTRSTGQSIALYIKKIILNCQKTATVDWPKQRVRDFQSVDRKGRRSTIGWPTMCTNVHAFDQKARRLSGRLWWPELGNGRPGDRPMWPEIV